MTEAVPWTTQAPHVVGIAVMVSILPPQEDEPAKCVLTTLLAVDGLVPAAGKAWPTMHFCWYEPAPSAWHDSDCVVGVLKLVSVVHVLSM